MSSDFLAASAYSSCHLEENRYLIFGMSRGGKYLVVSYSEPGDRIRMISARHMTPRERKAYAQ
jgi:hypothetical protein